MGRFLEKRMCAMDSAFRTLMQGKVSAVIVRVRKRHQIEWEVGTKGCADGKKALPFEFASRR